MTKQVLRGSIIFLAMILSYALPTFADETDSRPNVKDVMGADYGTEAARLIFDGGQFDSNQAPPDEEPPQEVLNESLREQNSTIGFFVRLQTGISESGEQPDGIYYFQQLPHDNHRRSTNYELAIGYQITPRFSAEVGYGKVGSFWSQALGPAVNNFSIDQWLAAGGTKYWKESHWDVNQDEHKFFLGGDYVVLKFENGIAVSVGAEITARRSNLSLTVPDFYPTKGSDTKPLYANYYHPPNKLQLGGLGRVALGFKCVKLIYSVETNDISANPNNPEDIAGAMHSGQRTIGMDYTWRVSNIWNAPSPLSCR